MTAADLAHDIIIVPETTIINDLLVQFREEHQQMAAVIDEWGSLEGIATVEEVIEALVGDLRDAFDIEAAVPSLRRRRDGGFDVDGGVAIATLNDVLDVELNHEAVETVGELVLSRLDRVPEPGDTVEIAGYSVEVTGVDGTRIATFRIHDHDADAGEEA